MAFRHLPFFAVLAEEENFQKAAARLHITQPALSRRIQDLEAWLGVTLLERTQGRARLTEAGRLFGREARRITDDFDASVTRVRRFASEQQGQLRIGCNELAMSFTRLTECLGLFRQENEAINLTLSLMSSANQLQALRQGDLDLAFLYVDENEPAPIRSRALAEKDVFAIAVSERHPLADRTDIRLADLADEDLIWPSADSVPLLYERLRAAWAAAGLTPRIKAEITSNEASLDAVAAGLGVAVVRSSNLGREPRGVRVKLVADLQIGVSMRAAWSEQARSAARDKLLELLASRDVLAGA